MLVIQDKGGIMTLKNIKQLVLKNIDKEVKVIYNGSRNRREEYFGTIKEVYNYIFIVKLDTDEVKSFSYSDVLTNTVQIFFGKI